MNYEVISKALKFDPLAVTLVFAGVKPSSFIVLKYSNSVKAEIEKINYKIQRFNQYPQISFFYYLRDGFEDQVCLYIFNDQIIKSKINLINKYQKSWKLKSCGEIQELLLDFYKNKDKKKSRTDQQKIDINIISGILFGFPLANVRKFAQEVANKNMVKKRKGHYVKSSPSLAFIGYDSTKKVSKQLIEKWLVFKKNRMKKESQSIQKKLMLL